MCALIVSIKSCDRAENAFKISNRAYISISIEYLPSGGEENHTYIANVVFWITNLGKTPAYNVNIYPSIKISDSTSINIANPYTYHINIGPGINYKTNTCELKIDIPSNETKSFSKNRFAFIFGYITYKDFFGDVQTTDFNIKINKYHFKAYYNYNYIE